MKDLAVVHDEVKEMLEELNFKVARTKFGGQPVLEFLQFGRSIRLRKKENKDKFKSYNKNDSISNSYKNSNSFSSKNTNNKKPKSTKQSQLQHQQSEWNRFFKLSLVGEKDWKYWTGNAPSMMMNENMNNIQAVAPVSCIQPLRALSARFVHFAHFVLFVSILCHKVIDIHSLN